MFMEVVVAGVKEKNPHKRKARASKMNGMSK